MLREESWGNVGPARESAEGTRTPQERENATQRPIYERGTPAPLREYIRRRLLELAWERAVYGDGTGRPTGIVLSPTPNPQQDAD